MHKKRKKKTIENYSALPIGLAFLCVVLLVVGGLISGEVIRFSQDSSTGLHIGIGVAIIIAGLVAGFFAFGFYVANRVTDIITKLI